MTRALILFLLIALLGVQSARATSSVLVSGFDDVLRQAENQNLLRAGLRLFSTDETFTGMPELYSEWLKANGGEKVSVVSGTSSLFRNRILEFLDEKKFPRSELRLRNWLTEWSVERFKVEAIRGILGNDHDRKFAVIFDNSPPSLEMAKSIPEAFPGRVLGIYLHEIVERSPIPGARQFITAFDIAAAESSEGRLSIESVRAVGRAILEEKEPGRLIPAYAYCPLNYEPCPTSKEERMAPEVCGKVREKIRAICRARS